MLLLCIIATTMTQGGDILLPEHPRPDFQRAEWVNLNGTWGFAFDAGDTGVKDGWFKAETPLHLLGIIVPFPWESKLSTIAETGYRGVVWYRRNVTPPAQWQGKRIWLCFGAVDWQARVWVNGTEVGSHVGGYSEFRLDVTEAMRPGQENLVVVRAEDHTDSDTPLGKQIPSWYTSTSGIWQTVWMEATGQARLKSTRYTVAAGGDGAPNGTVRIQAEVDRGTTEGELALQLTSPESAFPTVTIAIPAGSSETQGEVVVPSPHFWSPNDPHLYRLVVSLRKGADLLDQVESYFGLRTVSWGTYAGSTFSYVLLNGKPIYLRGALDQSFNPEGIYTSPTDDFRKRDMELAKQAGFNMLRIHVKTDEPRRLYWADKLGILIQADMPSHYNHTEAARQNFEMTLRDQIARDFNHPSIYCWTVFNEEWGIGRLPDIPEEHRVDWTEKMRGVAAELDPTRLVHDNSGWSHLITDLNSFHSYGRDVDGFRSRFREISESSLGEGKDWNYIAGRKQRGEPFVNNEYGYVSCGDGDGDWSWGVLAWTNAMRSIEPLVGYTYTELTDIEWEHNGVYNYDRSPKAFGYAYWAPGMTLRDVFAEDFLVLDVPAIKEAKPGVSVSVPALFSHFSGQHETGCRVGWEVWWLDGLGERHHRSIQHRDCPACPPYKLTPIGEIGVDMPHESGLVTLVAWLDDAEGRRVHTNYTQWRVTTGKLLPRAEALDLQTLVLRFEPADYASSVFSELSAPDQPLIGKHYGRGHGSVRYRLEVPAQIPMDGVDAATLVCEMASKAGREKVEWPQNVNPQDYPQTDEHTFPTLVHLRANGQEVTAISLLDDPADARGVLSHWRGIERGSYGYLEAIRIQPNLLRGRSVIDLEFVVPEESPHGLAIYGDGMGRFPMDPTLVLRSKDPHGFPPGWTSDEAVVVDRFLDRLQTVLPDAREDGTTWRYAFEQPAEGWTQPAFDDFSWPQGKAGFGTEGTPGAVVRTEWNGSDIWLRKAVPVPKLGPNDTLFLTVHHDEDCEIYVNGKLLWRGRGYVTDYQTVPLRDAQELFVEGDNTIAVHCRQTGGGQFIDVGLAVIPAAE